MDPKTVYIDGNSLTLLDIVNVARNHFKVSLTEVAKAAIIKARTFVEKKLEEGKVIYGLTTGFGEFQKILVKKEDAKTLQLNLITSHSCAMAQLCH